jgi:hypothetical protein
MDTFWWIFLSGVLMSVIALVDSVTLLLSQAGAQFTTVPSRAQRSAANAIR